MVDNLPAGLYTRMLPIATVFDEVRAAARERAFEQAQQQAKRR